MIARAKLVQKFQAFNWFKGLIVSRAQLDQRFIGSRVQLSQFAQFVQACNRIKCLIGSSFQLVQWFNNCKASICLRVQFVHGEIGVRV